MQEIVLFLTSKPEGGQTSKLHAMTNKLRFHLRCRLSSVSLDSDEGLTIKILKRIKNGRVSSAIASNSDGEHSSKSLCDGGQTSKSLELMST